MAHTADHLAAVLFHHLGHVSFEGMSESVVGGQHEPAVTTLIDDGSGGAVGQRIGIRGPVDVVRRAVFVGDTRRRCTVDDAQTIILFNYTSRGDNHRGGDQTGYQVDVARVVPFTHGIGAHVGAVAVVGTEDFNCSSVNATAEVLDRHTQRLQPTRPGQVTIGTGHVGQITDAYFTIADFCLGAGRHNGGGSNGNAADESLFDKGHDISIAQPGSLLL